MYIFLPAISIGAYNSVTNVFSAIYRGPIEREFSFTAKFFPVTDETKKPTASSRRVIFVRNFFLATHPSEEKIHSKLRVCTSIYMYNIFICIHDIEKHIKS